MTDLDLGAAAAEPSLIVIPCLNEEAHLPRVLAALLADPAAQAALIVVADGGSVDASRAIVEAVAAEHPQVRLMDNPARLQSAGFNLAVELYGEGRPWLIRVDAHAEYPANYASRLIAAAIATGADSIVVPMRSLGVGCFQRAAAAAQNSVLGSGDSAHRLGGREGWVDHGHHALIRAAAFAAVGGYDASFSHNEDAELDVRLSRQGCGVWLAGDLTIGYYPRATPWSLFRQYVNHGSGRARTVDKHRTPLKLRQMIPITIAPAVILAFASPWFWPAAIPVAVWAATCLLAGLYVGQGAGHPCARASGVAAMIAHLGWSIGYWRQLLRRIG